MAQIILFLGTMMWTVLPALALAFFVRWILRKYGIEVRYSNLVAVIFAATLAIYLQWISR